MRRLHLSPRQAFSLVEVVASIFLVGTLLVAILAAHRGAAKQILLAGKRLDAISALESLLEARELSGAGDLHLASGKAPGANPYLWRSTLRIEPGLDQAGGAILRIELYDPVDEGQTLAYADLVAPAGAGSFPGVSP